MHFQKLQKNLSLKKIIASASVGILFTFLLVFTTIVFAFTTWEPGIPPQAAPGEGNVELSGLGLGVPVCPTGYILVSDGVSWNCANQEFCTPDCDGKECGDDGCGESCGSCLATETCSTGSCILACTSHSSSSCYGDDVYWYNSCGVREDKKTDCGISGYSGINYCYDGDVYHDYITRSCSGSSCTSSTSRVKVQDCSSGCSGGSCVSCISHTSSSCYGGDVYWYNSCGVREDKKTDCGAATCSGGVCGTCECSWIGAGGSCSSYSCGAAYSGGIYRKLNCDGCHATGYSTYINSSCSTSGSCSNLPCASGYYRYDLGFSSICRLCPTSSCTTGSCTSGECKPGRLIPGCPSFVECQ